MQFNTSSLIIASTSVANLFALVMLGFFLLGLIFFIYT
jgi:hypothetical protein